MISVNDFYPGLTIELEGEIYIVLEYQHVHMAQGQATVRVKLKNLKTGNVIRKTFKSDEYVPQAFINKREAEYLYKQGDEYYFIDNESFEQYILTEEQLGDAIKYLKEGNTVSVLFYEGNPIGIELPTTVVLEVVETDPGLRGDTVSGGSKPAKLETGLVIQVPLFIQIGDKVVVDTRYAKYVERA
ncbi:MULTISPECIES: elongation factor P [Dictyoglomus]|jgi:elongation factor P|uniref:Elongation factor P n=1 Tax=Dictyoglomus turgidum (strain DSM 6724 / Z-1310) TaxID=515635 RepID=EFP_DICTD|nr:MULTISPECIES: elongation factor P [Dictyoglomus]B8E240.1 RecName: Full=Elongation factor P; Short=EF-P [Dictyoglomus turgidum DSM 6724]ACK42317.1 translation elongation factor P [Dictyoglomus turgidum DSM 6724]PNV80778.1 MAG: elongation factor P [Dictyoglomus turgidum]HBU32228.1 elongation factor P [Dictyoglomus sp.]